MSIVGLPRLTTARLAMDPFDFGRDAAGLEDALAQPGTLEHVGAGLSTAADVRKFVAERAGDPTILTVRRGREIIGFSSFEILGGGWAELGVVLAPSFHRQGFATEVLAALIELAMKQPSLLGALAGIKPANIAARGLVEKLGFIHVGNVPAPRSAELAYRLSRADHAAARARG